MDESGLRKPEIIVDNNVCNGAAYSICTMLLWLHIEYFRILQHCKHITKSESLFKYVQYPSCSFCIDVCGVDGLTKCQPIKK